MIDTKQDWENYCVEKQMSQIETLYAEFWLWSKANGYEIALGDMKKAWEIFSKTELTEKDKMLFRGQHKERMRTEFNSYCARRIQSEREWLKKQRKGVKAV